ncbi:hypothetical protein [Methylobacterium platani]|uniref:Uncharacterized protein n=2 Tax=Methylobacterium platani TaxID=427683 RepID=A0A179SCB7_9HYPH|nr:hypothetical protein [Methylobacterium platani]KMO10714.1 hypothetical protein SQ03_29290 [Methylobacterium platani JCM 14648]OAS25285.1 hypothetical protein A5481_10240 [Methylobacterium platani]
MQRRDEDGSAAASSRPAGAGRAAWPGSAPAAASAVAAGLVCWFVLLPQLAERAPPPAGGDAALLAEVAPDERSGALATMEPRSPVTAKARQDAGAGQEEGACGVRLAWISLARAPGEPPGSVRILSGGYASPLFPLTETPARVAIPYPAPYETGRGSLTVLESGAAAVVALTPPWRVAVRSGREDRAVTWHPAPCRRGGA